MFCAVSDYAECGDVYQSQTGSYPCSVLLHVCGENDADLIEKILVYIVNLCENLKVTSVAIPALRTGKLPLEIHFDNKITLFSPQGRY